MKNFDQAEEYNLAKLNSHVIKDVKYKQWRIKYKNKFHAAALPEMNWRNCIPISKIGKFYLPILAKKMATKIKNVADFLKNPPSI